MITLLKVGKRSVEIYWRGGVWSFPGFFMHHRWLRNIWIGGIRIAY